MVIFMNTPASLYSVHLQVLPSLLAVLFQFVQNSSLSSATPLYFASLITAEHPFSQPVFYSFSVYFLRVDSQLIQGLQFFFFVLQLLSEI